jgi:hypothetical protein
MKRKNILAIALVGLGSLSLVFGWPWGYLVGAILMLAGVISLKSHPNNKTEGERPIPREATPKGQANLGDGDLTSETSKLKKIISDLANGGNPVPQGMIDRLNFLTRAELEKAFCDYDLIICKSGDSLANLGDFAKNLRIEQHWPLTGSILGHPDATEQMDWVFSRIETLEGQVPVRELGAMMAICGEGLERYYFFERLKRGWPSLFGNEHDLKWSNSPGLYERYLKQRHNNVLFRSIKRCVSRYDLNLARLLDEENRNHFLTEWKIVIDPIMGRPDRTSVDATIDHLKRLFDLLEKAVLIGGVESQVDSAKQAYHALVETLSQGLEGIPSASESLKQAEASRWAAAKFSLNPTIMYLTSLPDKADYVAALLSEPIEAIALIKTFSEESDLDPIRAEIMQMMQHSVEARNFLRFHPAKLTALGVSPL